MASAHILLPTAGLIAGLALPPAAAVAQPPPGSLEARVRALEARMAAIEARAASTPAGAAAGPACRRLNVNGSRIPPGGALSVTVNGAVVSWRAHR